MRQGGRKRKKRRTKRRRKRKRREGIEVDSEPHTSYMSLVTPPSLLLTRLTDAFKTPQQQGHIAPLLGWKGR